MCLAMEYLKIVNGFLIVSQQYSLPLFCTVSVCNPSTAYVADWKVQLDAGAPHEVKDHSVEVR